MENANLESILSVSEIEILKSEKASDWLKQKAEDENSRSFGGTNAQALYRKFRHEVLTADSMQMIASIKDEAERAKKRNKLIKDKMDECFALAGIEGFTGILMQECKNQQQQKRKDIKRKALEEGLTLYHATPLAKEQLEGGVLKGKIERPDLVWEDIFTGVCAFPKSKGAYVLKKADALDGFACQGERNVRLSDNRLEGKKIDDVLGYVHGHKLREDDGFMPTVSLGGEVVEEWTTTQDVSIDESQKVTLRTLAENDVHVFKVEEGFSLRHFKEYADKIESASTQEEYIQADIDMMEEMAAYPDKLWTDEQGHQRKVQVKSYYETTRHQIEQAKNKSDKKTAIQIIRDKIHRRSLNNTLSSVKSETKKKFTNLRFLDRLKKSGGRC